MDKNSKIYVAGHKGLVGSAIIRCLVRNGHRNVLTKTRDELDLTKQLAVDDFFRKEKPEYVLVGAAKVGGIYANNTYPADFIYTNIMIAANVISSAHKTGVKKLLFLGSSCLYPKYAKQPMKESYLLDGKPEPTNEPYAIAKIAGIKMCESYNRQYGTDFISAMPTNLYGPGDNFDPTGSHVMPGLIRRFYEAKVKNDKEVVVWGTGAPKREFLYIDDLADACVFLMNNYSNNETINIGSGNELTIKELTEHVKKVVGYKGKIVFDITKPDGAPRKLLDISKLSNLGWKANMPFVKGLEEEYKDFLERTVK
ncbi:GDP-L-fucose synthase [uncultured archaeon]|nr:GDP-L-fucose synthase [uncultured archaeon]